MPVFPVDGYISADTLKIFNWCVKPSQRDTFWNVLVKHKVNAYLCAHIISYDVQVHNGILQIQSGGAGFPLNFPKGGEEYHHIIQMAVDNFGLRYNTIDINGNIRDSLSWPLKFDRKSFSQMQNNSSLGNALKGIVFQIKGQYNKSNNKIDLIESVSSDSLKRIWIGIENNKLKVEMLPLSSFTEKNKFPNDMSDLGVNRIWYGCEFKSDCIFDIEFAIVKDFGPAAFMYRIPNSTEWTSLETNNVFGLKEVPDKWIYNADMKVKYKIIENR